MSKLRDKSIGITSPELKRIAQQALAKKSLRYRIENHLWIKTEEGKLQKFSPLKKSQRKLLAVYEYCHNVWKIPCRILVYKDRRVGMSTLVEAILFCEVIDKGYDAIVIAHEVRPAAYIFNILKRFYQHYDLKKPELERINKRELKVANGEGLIEVLTAKQAHSSRASGAQIIHASEYAFYDSVEAIDALAQTIGDELGTSYFKETTPNGEDPSFKPEWDNAYSNCTLTFEEDVEGEFIPRIEIHNRDEWNGYIPFYVSALDDEDCYFEVDETEADRIMQTLDSYERGLVERFGATPQFLKWRRHTLAHKCRGDLRRFMAEYSCTAAEGFIISGESRFDVAKLNLMGGTKGSVGVLRKKDNWRQDIEFLSDPGGILTIFKKPIKGHKYVIGCDTSSGLVPEGGKDPDNSVAIVLDLDDGGRITQVATLCGHETEEYLADPLCMLATYYNNAYINVELVGGRGEHLIERLLEIYNPSLIYRRLDSQGRPMRGRVFGFVTHTGNRKQIIDDLAQVFHNEGMELLDERTIAEMKYFKRSHKGKYEAAPGKHDDHVMALCMAVQALNTYPYELDPYRQYMDSPGRLRAIRENRKKLTSTRSSVTGY